MFPLYYLHSSKLFILRLVDMLTDERHHVSRMSHPSQVGVEDKFRHSCGCLDLGLENVSLQRVQEALLEQLIRYLIRNSLRGFDEHLVGDSFRLRRKDRHADRRENVEVVGLARQKRLA